MFTQKEIYFSGELLKLDFYLKDLAVQIIEHIYVNSDAKLFY